MGIKSNMNKNKLIREGMVFGIIILFVGASVASGISAHNSTNYSYNNETTAPEKFIFQSSYRISETQISSPIILKDLLHKKYSLTIRNTAALF